MKDKELKKAVLKLAKEKPELRKHLLPLVRKEARSGEKFQILVRFWELTSVEDDFEQGEFGRETIRQTGKELTADNIGELVKKMGRETGCPTDKKAWGIDSGTDGRIHCEWTGDDQGIELSKREMDAWKKRQMKAYTWRLLLLVQFTRTWEPNAKDIQKATGLQTY